MNVLTLNMNSLRSCYQELLDLRAMDIMARVTRSQEEVPPDDVSSLIA